MESLDFVARRHQSPGPTRNEIEEHVHCIDTCNSFHQRNLKFDIIMLHICNALNIIFDLPNLVRLITLYLYIKFITFFYSPKKKL